ncbi:DUF3365 domain-containing protein [Pseudomonadota bacterium]
MKTMISTVAVLAALSTATIANAADADLATLKAEAAKVTMSFGGPLKKTLGAAMKDGGPVAAIGACNEKAPGIAKAAADASGWSVGRTSLKLRNTDNAADAWEMSAMKEFEARRASGEKPDTISKAEIVDMDGQKTFRFMKAIGTAPVCLNCHGAEIKPEVAAKLDSLYPHDTARGFKAGDIRGVFTLSKKL